MASHLLLLRSWLPRLQPPPWLPPPGTDSSLGMVPVQLALEQRRLAFQRPSQPASCSVPPPSAWPLLVRPSRLLPSQLWLGQVYCPVVGGTQRSRRSACRAPRPAPPACRCSSAVW